MSTPYVVGLTGGIAMGKSTLSAALKKAGARIVDADAASHALTAPGGAALPLIKSTFGAQMFEGETLNRRALSTLVFANEEKRMALNRIMHPLIIDAIAKQIAACPDALLVLEVPLLFETGLDKLCDETWCAYAPQSVQLERLMARDSITRAQALRIIKSQMPARERNKRATHVIFTNQGRETAANHVLCLYNTLLQQLRAK